MIQCQDFIILYFISENKYCSNKQTWGAVTIRVHLDKAAHVDTGWVKRMESLVWMMNWWLNIQCDYLCQGSLGAVKGIKHFVWFARTYWHFLHAAWQGFFAMPLSLLHPAITILCMYFIQRCWRQHIFREARDIIIWGSLAIGRGHPSWVFISIKTLAL